MTGAELVAVMNEIGAAHSAIVKARAKLNAGTKPAGSRVRDPFKPRPAVSDKRMQDNWWNSCELQHQLARLSALRSQLPRIRLVVSNDRKTKARGPRPSQVR